MIRMAGLIRCAVLSMICLSLVAACAGHGERKAHKALRPAVSDTQAAQEGDVRLYNAYVQNGRTVRLQIQASTSLTTDIARQALARDFDALYFLLKAAPEAVVRVETVCPSQAGRQAGAIVRYLQEGCNLASGRIMSAGYDSPAVTTCSAVITVTAPHKAVAQQNGVMASRAASPHESRPIPSQEHNRGETPSESPPDMEYTYHFSSGSTSLEKELREGIAAIARRMQADHGLKAVIEGHTDNVGSADNNMLLSYQRALSMQIALITAYGIEPERIQVKGLGEEYPVADNGSPEGRSMNRRVRVVFTSVKPSAAHTAATRTGLPAGEHAVLSSRASSTPLPPYGDSSDVTSPSHDVVGVTFGLTENRGHFVATSLRNTRNNDVQLAKVRYEPLPQNPRRYRIEISVSKCTLWLYEIMSDGSKRLLRPFKVATAKRGTPWPKGEGVVTEIDFDPWWYPTQNMVNRARKLGKRLVPVPPGASDNPMGAFKIHLSHRNAGGAYRIHGTNQPWQIGKRVSLGCIRMHNDEGLELARIIPVGTQVVIGY